VRSIASMPLVVQSVVFLALVREDAVYVEREQTDDLPVGSMPVEEKIEDITDAPEQHFEDTTPPWPPRLQSK